MNDIEGFILAGGESARMGVAKASVKIGGETMLERAVRAASGVTSRIKIVGGDAVPNCEVIPDLPSDVKGALVGLRAALANTNSTWMCVLACDLPFVTGDLLLRLSSFCRDEIDAVIPRQSDGRLQPLCAFYKPSTCLPIVNDAIESGEMSLRRLAEKVNTRVVNYDEMHDLDADGHLLFNVNTPADLQHAQARCF